MKPAIFWRPGLTGFIGCAVLFLAMPVRADCRQPETQFAAQDCLHEELSRSEAAVRRALRRAEKAIDGDEREANRAAARRALAQAQRAWLLWRDRECVARVTLDAGQNNAGMNETQCRIELNRQRQKDLAALR